MAGREYTPTEISSLILRRIKEDAESRTGEEFARVVITVPAYFGERQVAATREAGKLAGFRVLNIISEPTAAALAFGLIHEETDDSKTVLVYDLGGGTFDISIMMMASGMLTVMGTEGDNLLGGDDFDDLITSHLLQDAQDQFGVDLSKDRKAQQAIKSKSEETKISLSSGISAEITLPSLGKEAIDLEGELSRVDFEKMISQKIDQTIELTFKAIKDADLIPDDIDYILLVGGSTAIPLVESKLTAIFGASRIRKDVNPMQCVALGAAVRTSLETEIECLNCHKQNSINEENCSGCGSSLLGEDRISCPTCFMLSHVSETVCWKCGGALRGAGGAVPAQIAPKPREVNCPTCGKPFKPGTKICAICTPDAVVEGGLKCSKCGKLNPPGVIECVSCQGSMLVGPTEITSKDLGIELQDGSMEVILQKGTVYPTEDSHGQDFYTAAPGQRRLEIPIYEGPFPVARQNDLVGMVTMGLPEGLPYHTPVYIAFGLDKDRTITVAVKLRGMASQVKNARLQRGLMDPNNREKVDRVRHELTQFVDRWDPELTDAERGDFNLTLELLDQAINEDIAKLRMPIDELLNQVERKTKLAVSIRGSDAFTSAILRVGEKYMTSESREIFEQISNDFDQARARADWAAAEMILQRSDEAEAQLSPQLIMVIHTKTMADQNKVSLSLQNRIYDAHRQLDAALEHNNKDEVEKVFDLLYELWEKIKEELDRAGQSVPTMATRVTKDKS
jgi:molecular chaperone DnaK (HSP70)